MKYSGKEIEELLAMIPGKTDVETAKRLIDSAIGAFDAPSDGKRYVRRNGEWEEIESAGEMSVMLPPETPTSYGKPGQWSEDDTYLYFCTSPNVWIRLEKTTW